MILTVLLLPVLLGAAALTVDLGLLWAVQAKLTTIADAAALAGAVQFVEGRSAQNASSAATTIAAANAYAAYGLTSTATINIPPVAPSAFAGQSNCVQAVIQFNQPALFSAIWGTKSLPITVRAVAQAVPSPYSTAAILLLAPSGPALMLTGSPQVSALNGNIVVDSTSSSSITSSGTGSITAPVLDLAGGVTYASHNPDNATVTNFDQPNTPDPLANITAPSSGGMTVQSNSAINLSGTKSMTLSPGVYDGGISMSGSSSVALSPGIYFINGGGINMSGGTSISGNGVFIYNTGGGAINLSGTGNISLSPMSTGAYAGITVFQDRASSVGATMSGASNVSNTGTFYFPDAALTMSGGSGVGVVGSQFITKTLTFSGSSQLKVNFAAKVVASTYTVSLVE